MLISHTEGYVLDIKDFMKWFPFGRQSVIRHDARSYSIELDHQREFTFLDVITWFLDEYTIRKPLRIEFDYHSDYSNITVVFRESEFSFTFFDYE